MRHAGECKIGIKRGNDVVSPEPTCSCCSGTDAGCTKRFCVEKPGIDEDGQTQLHLLCQDRSCSVDDVRKLIISLPTALQRRDVYGRSPLFYALKRACSVDVVNLLFDSFPEAIVYKDFCGDTALYLLYHCSKDYRILEHVLRRMPSLAVHQENTFSGQTLIKRICAPWTSRQLTLSRLDVEANAALKDRWAKLVITVRAAHAYTTGQQQATLLTQIPELHVALEFSCPPLVLSHFVEMYPEQASMIMGKRGCYPLHYLLSRRDPTCDSKSAIRNLISAFPEAVHQRVAGRIPIHLAITSGHSWKDGMEDIVYAGPDSLDHPDPQTGLIPFLQAGALGGCDMTTVYSLLRENPAVIANLSKSTSIVGSAL